MFLVFHNLGMKYWQILVMVKLRIEFLTQFKKDVCRLRDYNYRLVIKPQIEKSTPAIKLSLIASLCQH